MFDCVAGYAVVFEVDEAGLLEAGEDFFGGRGLGFGVAVKELGEVYELYRVSLYYPQSSRDWACSQE